MLNKLSIKNVAVIDSVDAEFYNGMTVLTGETGAGKSIIIDSINMILGDRTNKDLVRYGQEKASVQAVFDANNDVLHILDEYGIDIEDNQIIITRNVNNEGKSIAKVNGEIVTLGVLREIASALVNIHGQHDNQTLLSAKKHINFLDSFAHCDCELSTYKSIYKELNILKKQADALNQDEQEMLRRVDLLEYQIKEIEQANLSENEEEELKEQQQIYENAEKISQGINEAYSNIYQNNESLSAYDSICIAIKALDSIREFDCTLENAYNSLSSAMYAIEDVSHEILSFGENVEYDENILNDIESRLDLISKLKRKYGATITDIKAFLDNAKKELNDIQTHDEQLRKLNIEIDKKTKELTNAAKILSKKRTDAACELSEKIEISLHELNMEKSKISVNVEMLDDFSENGIDKVEFMISTNPGEPLKPLTSIASGGELSRVMLAIKSIIALDDDVDTLIFDEIDTGVSGNAAIKIAQKLKKIGTAKQVICITHLPQICAGADHHYLIIKNADDKMARTSLKHLNEEERITELARIIDGREITPSAYNHAKELLSNSI